MSDSMGSDKPARGAKKTTRKKTAKKTTRKKIAKKTTRKRLKNLAVDETVAVITTCFPEVTTIDYIFLTQADDLDHKNISRKQIQLPSKSSVGPNGSLRLLP